MKPRFVVLAVLSVVAAACTGVDPEQSPAERRGTTSAYEVQAVASATARIANSFAGLGAAQDDVVVIVAAFEHIRPLSEMLGGVTVTEISTGLKFSNGTGAVKCSEWVRDGSSRIALTDCNQQAIYFGSSAVLQRDPSDDSLNADELDVLASAMAGVTNAYTNACLTNTASTGTPVGSLCTEEALALLERAALDLETLSWMLGYENDTQTGPIKLETGLELTNGAGASVCVEMLSNTNDALPGSTGDTLNARMTATPTDCARTAPRG